MFKELCFVDSLDIYFSFLLIPLLLAYNMFVILLGFVEVTILPSNWETILERQRQLLFFYLKVLERSIKHWSTFIFCTIWKNSRCKCSNTMNIYKIYIQLVLKLFFINGAESHLTCDYPCCMVFNTLFEVLLVIEEVSMVLNHLPFDYPFGALSGEAWVLDVLYKILVTC